MDKEKITEQVKEIESYYDCKLAELVVRLSKNPLVRHFKGEIYRVIGVGKDCLSDVPQVLYTPLNSMGNIYWTRELCNFLSPIDKTRDDNVTGQERRFEFVDNMVTQLDLISDEDLIKELERRSNDMTIVENQHIVEDDWVIARVMYDPQTSKMSLYAVQNYFDSKEQAEENLERNRRHRKLLSEDYRVLHRIYFI